jgi:hypothetical protein
MAAAGILGGCAERKAQVGSVVTSLMAPISDNAFLEDVARRAFLYFWEQGDPANGLVRDRSLADGSKPPTTDRYSASIAATGFGLSAMAIAADHKWMDENQLRDRVYNTLHFFAYQAPGKNGFFYHWLDLATGERVRSSEVSSIDSALLMAGVLTARERWAADPDIVELANLIYRKMDFDWLLDKRGLLSHGWRPEMGMLKSNWDTYSEHMILYLLAIGSPTHPIPASSWYSWSRPKVTYNEYTFVSDGPLFTQQYSHAWVDFRGLRDRPPSDINWFQNAITATEAHRQFCISLKDKFPDYGPQLWGITASDSVGGYRIWGGPPADKNIDGTVVPCAAGGSLMLTPQVSINTLRYMRNQFGNRIFGRYGFTDAFNPVRNWVDPEIIGIDQGIILLSAVNARNEGVWKWFMRAEEIRDAMQKIGFERDSPHQPALANARVRKS